jgi:membrane protease YdiL (CAAX protease family)
MTSMTTSAPAPSRVAPQPAAAIPANSEAALAQRVATGRLGWGGPLTLVFGRTALLVLAQALVAGLFWLQGRAAPWQAAAPWWTVWATLADVGCLAALLWWTRREGIRLADLFSFDRRRLRRDLLLAAGILLLVFPVCIMPGTMLASWLVFGTTQAPMYAGELTGRVLPAWAMAYSAALWWPLWSMTEELTYNGYALPRLAALLRRRWPAVALVGLMFAAQHAAIPTIFDGRYLLWRTLAFLPLSLALSVIYLRTRRLLPLVVAHWGMDIFGGVFFTMTW